MPRTPPPTLHSEARESYDLELSTDTGVLRASAMGRLFSSPSPDDILSEDTDTSLFDYEQARGTLSYVTAGCFHVALYSVSAPNCFQKN